MRANIRNIVLTLILCAASRALGWGGEGHQIVALIAENHLTPETQKAVHELLDGANISDAEIASWADQIRNERINTKPWHYVNIPLNSKGFDRKRDANNGDNVIDKIVDFTNVLADKSKPKKDRAEALKYLTHFVGDVHQPLHAADRNDAGGNRMMVSFPEEPNPISLHFVWDTKLIRTYVGMSKIIEYADSIDKRIPKNKIDEISKGAPVEWADESFKVAAQSVYNGLPESGQGNIDANYIKNSRNVVEGQLAKGGLRLAKLLNETLSAKK